VQTPQRSPEAVLQNTVIYYDLRELHVEKTLPNLNAAGRGGEPLPSSRQASIPRSESSHPRLTIAMNPPLPDNRRQTVIQSASPPDLTIDHQINIPNILIGSIAKPSRPALPLGLSPPRPLVTRDSNMTAPALADNFVDASNEPIANLSVLAPAAAPALPISPMPAPHPLPRGKNPGSVGGDSVAPMDAPTGLLAIDVEPSALDDFIALSPGNRYGSFLISPAEAQPGPPDDALDATTHQGSSPAGTGSVGGGGGEASGASLPLTVRGGNLRLSGAAAAEDEDHALLGAVSAGQIFPVLTTPAARGLNLQIFTGSAGGGGLGVYHELPCNKVYTAILPMPHKNWILQYCTPKPDGTNASATGSRVLQLDQGLVSPQATDKFDFKRPARSTEALGGQLIVLRGAISEDGTVADLVVLSGARTSLDLLAAGAFRQWKFRPAMRSGKPIRVEILVGIPAVTP
jgi:hypothetical protein